MPALEQIFGLCNAAMWFGLLRYLASPAAAEQTAPVVISDQSRASAAALLGSAWIEPNGKATIEQFAALARRTACDGFVP